MAQGFATNGNIVITSAVDLNNSTSTPLNSGNTFTGTATDALQYPSVVVACYTDQAGSLYVDFSVDGTNWDSTLTYQVAATTNEVHRIVVTRRYFRVRFTNSSASNQTYLRLQSILGSHDILNSALNSTIPQDADSITTRTISDEIAISSGYFEGYSIVNKFGRNTDIDTATVPEDLWNGGGVYAGFPTGSPEEIQVFSSSASDTGTLTFTYLATSTSTAYQTASVTLNGTTQVNTGITAFRVHTAQYSTGAATTFNVGEITIRHRTTTANVFIVMPIGTSQNYSAGYRIPSGYTGKVTRLFCRVYHNTSGSVNGAIWVRTNGASPILRRPFSASDSQEFEERPYGGLTIAENSDITIRITSASANNLSVIGGYDITLIKNI